MVRDQLLAGDLTVAGGALLGRVRQQRMVRIMAAYTGLARIVQLRYDLRKAGRSGRVVAVADRAEAATAWDAGGELIRRLDMSQSRPVT